MGEEGKEGKLGVVEPHQDEDRAGGVRRYRRSSAARGVEERLWADRARLVGLYLGNSKVFPNGPDGRAWGCEAWYVPGEWALVDGVAVRRVTGSVTVTGVTGKSENVTEVSVTRSSEGGDRRLTPSEKQRRYRDRLRAARAALAGVEGKG